VTGAPAAAVRWRWHAVGAAGRAELVWVRRTSQCLDERQHGACPQPSACDCGCHVPRRGDAPPTSERDEGEGFDYERGDEQMTRRL
jgi:hypothetical protein